MSKSREKKGAVVKYVRKQILVLLCNSDMKLYILRGF